MKKNSKSYHIFVQNSLNMTSGQNLNVQEERKVIKHIQLLMGSRPTRSP